MIARPVLAAGVASLLLASLGLASPALASAVTPSGQAQGVPPPAERIAATTATFNAIEAKIAAGQSLRLRFPDPTAQEDIIDYGVNGLWKRAIDGAGVTVAYVVTNPDPNLETSMATYDAAMDLPPANITDMALPAPTDPSAVCQIECSTGEDRLDAEAIHSMAPYANIIFVHPPVPETIGMQGWPQVAQAIEMIADQHLADIITVSLGDGENDFINDPTNPTATQQAAIHSLDPAFLDAAAHNIPVMFAAGDCGPTDPPVSATPASAPRRSASPRVTRSTTHGSPRSVAPSLTLASPLRPGVPPRMRCGPPRTITPTRRARAYPPSTPSRGGSGHPGVAPRQRPRLPRHLDGCR